MNSNILVVVLLAYFLDNLSAATLKPVKSTSLNGKNTPAQNKNTLGFNQPTKSHHPVFGNIKVKPTVPYNFPAPPSPPAPPAPPKPPTLPPSHTFLPSIKPLPPSRASAPTTVPTNENDNHQEFDSVEEGDDYYYEEEEEDEEEEEEEEKEEKHLENSKLVKIPTQSKPATSTKVNNSSNKFQTSQPKLSSSTSTKPIVPESVKQENGNQQGFETLEGDDDEEEIEDEDHEEPLENSKTVTSQPMLSSSISKPTVPESVNQEYDNQQGFETLEGDDYEEEEIEDEDHEEPLDNSKTVTSQPMLSSSISKPTVPECVNQEYDNQQGFETLEGDDYEEVSEENEDGHNVEEYSEDPDHNTSTDNITINGVRVNLPAPMNNPIVPQLSEDELTANSYNESEYSLNTDEDQSSFQNDDKWEPKSSNIDNNLTEISKTLDRKNDNTKDQLINTNKFESNPYDNTQIPTDKQEENSEYQFKNQYVSENKERIINGYKAMKKILYMLHDYASSIFNWIMSKINYRMEQVSS